jgi:hypothetical protein
MHGRGGHLERIAGTLRRRVYVHYGQVELSAVQVGCCVQCRTPLQQGFIVAEYNTGVNESRLITNTFVRAGIAITS